MLTTLRAYVAAPAAALFLLSAPVFSASVTVLPNAPETGTVVDLQVSDFQRVGNCGGGYSVINDGCSVVMKSDPTTKDAYGRFDPQNHGYWIDSQDIDELKWTVTSQTAFTSLTFALTDAHDQDNSHFTMSYYDGDSWSPIWGIATKQENGNLFWLSIAFDAPVTMAELLFSTKVGGGYDGYSISSVSIQPAPVPLPPAALLMLSGGAALAGLRRWKRRS